MTINTKIEKATEEVVVADITTTDNATMTIVIEIIKIETEIMIGKIMMDKMKIGSLESTKTENMETKTMKKEIIIKTINLETERIIVNPETKIMTEKMEEKKSITLKMNPKRRSQSQEMSPLKKTRM